MLLDPTESKSGQSVRFLADIRIPRTEGKTLLENPHFCLQQHDGDVDSPLSRGKSLKATPEQKRTEATVFEQQKCRSVV